MEGAIVEGVYGLNRPPQADCPTGHCEFPTFTSLGICTKCTNVTAATLPVCEFPNDTVSYCSFQTSSGINISLVSTWDSMVPYDHGDGYDRVAYSYVHIQTESSSDDSNVTIAGIHSPLSAFASVRFNSYPAYLLPQLTPYEIEECAFYFCEKVYENATVRNGLISADPTPEKSRQLYETPWSAENDTYSWRYLSFYVSDNWLSTYRSTVATVNGTAPSGDYKAPPGREFLYAVHGSDIMHISEGLRRIFNLTGSDDIEMGAGQFDFIATPLWQASDLGDLIANVSTSMTDNMRSASSIIARVQGITYGQETYVEANWPWLALPAGIVLLGTAFLAVTIVSTAKHHALLWKSSSLALLLHGISIEWDEDAAASIGRERWEEMGSTRYLSQTEKLSEHYSVWLDPGRSKAGEEKGLKEEEHEREGGGRKVPKFVAQEKTE